MCTLDEMYSNFMKFLSCNDHGNITGSIFRPENTLEYMFQVVWSVPESKIFFRVANPNPSIYRKGQMQSSAFREQGNRLYKEGKLDKALEAYNYSILSAPFSTQDTGDKSHFNGDKEHSTECLSLGYANRSAVLFEMGQNQESILDIDRAIKYGYQKSKISKLYERKAKCLMNQEKFVEAAHILQSILNSLKTKGIEPYLKHVNRLLTACRTRDESYLKKANGIHFWELFYTGPPNLSEPQCATKICYKGKQSQCSDAIKVQHTPSKGRHLVATRNISPGEVLLSEESHFSVVTLDAKQRSYCCNCLRRGPIPLPCPTCSLVIFCSEECQNVATSHEGFHSKECSLLPSLICMRPDVNVTLALRVMCSFSLSDIKRQDKKCDGIEINQHASEAAFINLGYNYETLYNLEGNLKYRNKNSLIEAAVNAVVLVKLLLQNSAFFAENVNEFGTDGYEMHNRNTIYLVGAHIMRMILNFQCNSHCAKELKHLPKKALGTSMMDTIGHSVFCMLTLVNHSCTPNVFTSNLGNKKVMFAIGCIAAGEEICDSYGERFVSHDKKLRQTALEETYYFKCNCTACLEDWPLFCQLLGELVFKCQNCHQKRLQEDNCQECSKLNRSNKSKKKNRKHKDSNTDPLRSKQTNVIIKEYNNACQNLMNGKCLEENAKKIANFINYLEKHTVTPNKPLIEAQESLLMLFDMHGSQILLDAKN